MGIRYITGRVATLEDRLLQDLSAQKLQFFLGIKKVACPVAHQTPDGNVGFFPDLPQQDFVGGQSAGQQSRAKLQPVSAAGNGRAGGGIRVNADFQYLCHNDLLLQSGN